MKYKYLDHTADAAWIAYGKSLEEVFINSAEALFNIIVNTKEVKPKKKIEIEIESNRLLALMYDFIDQLLFYLDTEGFALAKVESMKIDGNHLKCTISGDHISNYDFTGDIKSVTYNDMYIKRTEQGWEARVVVDL